jgi:hypothetical protein
VSASTRPRTAAEWNALRFDPTKRKGHLESYFLKANDPTGERALWVRGTIFCSTREPDRPVAEGWAIAFDRRGQTPRHVAVKHVVPYADASFGARDLAIRWRVPAPPVGSTNPSGQDAASQAADDGVAITPSSTTGSIRTRDHHVRWDLQYTGDAPPIVPLPAAAMYTGPLPKSKLVTPVPDARFTGEVNVDGETWSLDGWRGMQGHNWGKGHADLYAWCHCNVWEQEQDFVLEGFSARVRVGPVMLPLTTIVCVRYRGVVYDFNRPLEIYRAEGDVSPRRWTFSTHGKLARIEGIVEADTDDMVGLYYPNPDGPMTYCLNSKIARARIRFEAAGRAPLSLTTRAAALEIGTRSDDHGVRMHV